MTKEKFYVDIALKEKELDDGLDMEEICGLYDLVGENRVIPVEFQAEHSAAMGFIGLSAAESIGYMYGTDTELGIRIRSILEDMDLENPECEYAFHNANAPEIRIWISR